MSTHCRNTTWTTTLWWLLLTLSPWQSLSFLNNGGGHLGTTPKTATRFIDNNDRRISRRHPRHDNKKPPQNNAPIFMTSSTTTEGGDDWEPLISDDPTAVQKRIVQAAAPDATVIEPGSPVEIDYVGTLAERSWTPQDVVVGWLSEQQGLDALAPLFLQHDVGGDQLMDETFFNDAFIATELGVSNKIQGKKLTMAARRLTGKEAYEAGTVFDASANRGAAYSFTLGSGKAIRAMDLGVATMKRGETAEILARSDYGYGKDGLRQANGNVIVPPFATLCFRVTLL